LLELSNLSPVIGRLRRHADINVALKAEQLAQQWHAAALAVYAHAKLHVDAA
jgi:stress-induced morphogen